MPDQPALMPIPVPYRPHVPAGRRSRSGKPHWTRWKGPHTTCYDCITERLGERTPSTDLLRALWRVESNGQVVLVCSVHAARRWRR